MKYALSCVLVFLGVSVLAQQQGQPPPSATNPPYETPPTFPEGQQAPRDQMPPDTQAPPPKATSNERVEGKIVDQLRAEPALSGSNVDAKVNDNSVVLTGSVETVEQHDLAVRMAQDNAGDRHIVDRIQVKQRT